MVNVLIRARIIESQMVLKIFSRLIQRWRKRRAIRSYVTILPRILKKRYGKRKRYTEHQVRGGMSVAQLDEGPNVSYALAMFLSRREFEGLNKDSEKESDYDSLRQEIGDSYFQGNAGFTIHYALGTTSTDGGFEVPASVGHGALWTTTVVGA